MKILWIANIPSPYRVAFFNEFGKTCELTVLFERSFSDERDGSWKKYSFDYFEGIILKGLKYNTDKAVSVDVLRFLKKKYDFIVVGNYSTFTGILEITYMKIHKIPYWIEGDGAFTGTGKGIKERIKKSMISGAQGWLSSGVEHDKFYLAYGADKDRIFRYSFTSVSKNDLARAKAISQDEKKTIRRKHNITEENILVSVGRFTYDREDGYGVNQIIELGQILGSRYGFYIIGDDQTREYIDLEEKGVSNVHFVGNKEKDALAEYYALADCFILISRDDAWGLCINEAMSYGLPIIASDRCIAVTELVKDGINGFVVPIDDIQLVSERIKRLFFGDIKKIFGQNSMEMARDYTIDNVSEENKIIFESFCTKNGALHRLIRTLARKRLNIDDNRIIILYVGQMIERKGIDILIEATNAVCSREDAVQLYLVGGELPDEYYNLIKDNVRDRIHTIPFIKPDELINYYKAANFFVLPSREDIWGLVINEAISFSLPVITTDMCGAGLEIVQDGKNGYIVPAGSVKDLIVAMDKMIEKVKSGSTDMEDKSRDISRTYTIENMAMEHTRIFGDFKNYNN